MERLAEYMLDAAQMTGVPEDTRFESIKKGSTRLAYTVSEKRVSVLRDNLWRLGQNGGTTRMRTARDRTAQRLQEDGVSAVVRDASKSVVLRIDPAPKEHGDFDFDGLEQEDTLKGTVIGIWDTKNGVSLALRTGGDLRDVVSVPEQLVEQANALYRKSVEVRGAAKWKADRGIWKLVSFSVNKIIPLKDESPLETLRRARAILGDEWAEGALEDSEAQRAS